MTDKQYQQFCAYLYQETGMAFPEAKRYYIERRVADRMAATALPSFAAYFTHLRSHASVELAPFINAFTVNETYFYREDYQLHCLTNDLLRRRIALKPMHQSLRLWSLPCSTGEEPYSIAIWLLENWDEVDHHDIEILGCDIDTQVLQAARAGVYGKRALMRLSEAVIAKYFERLDEERWRIIPDIRDSVAFSTANVINSNETQPYGRFDVIFCRNMLIYFDEASRRIAAENLYESLLPGGYLCLGHAESMSRISALFEVCRYDDAIVYQRPVEERHD
ncbi:CheR family methyltransferase [Acidocella sp.]|uniref:CheR family methyltransferase n=1 Tax=Acidocella sp. TaxID=50710 RepID=UPI002F3FFAEE